MANETDDWMTEQAYNRGYSRGAKETKERILIAIKMAGGMAEQFGNNPIISATLVHIYVLIEVLPIDSTTDQGGQKGVEK
ncbi:MAG: hypothetical protein H0X33_13310 [Taibaiella sp.]|nr:hypothetical protein [Taibaiella sp.]